MYEDMVPRDPHNAEGCISSYLEVEGYSILLHITLESTPECIHALMEYLMPD